MKQEELDKLQKRALARFVARDREYSRDCWSFLCDLVITLDEASQQKLRWPADREDLRELLAFIETEPKLAIPKSRRMMATWLVAAWATWLARYHSNHAIFIQSENEAKSAFVVDQRCAFIEDHLLEPMFRRPYNPIRTSLGSVGKMTYEGTGSYIRAVPQGGSVLRTYTPSVLVLDESDFQPEGHEAVTAAMSFVEQGKNAKLLVISSSNGPLGVLAGICRQTGFTRWLG